MQRIVSNATPLIYLSKADRLHLLRDIFEETFVPDAVYREVVIQGKQREEYDAFRIDREIRDGWIRVRSVREIYNTGLSIHPGEAEVISLARETGIKRILMDDIKARTAAETAGLSPRGALWLLLKAVKQHILDFDTFLVVLEDIVRSGFYLKEEVFLQAVHKAKMLSEK